MFELEVVIHDNYGGFSVDDEMALWLIENRGWTLLAENQYDYKKESELPLTTLVDFHFSNYSPHQHKIEFRSHLDLLDCVRAIKKLHEDDDYPDSIYGHIHSLSIKKIKVHVGVEDYHDGKERISCWMEFME